jgi:hypothetical protein
LVTLIASEETEYRTPRKISEAKVARVTGPVPRASSL